MKNLQFPKMHVSLYVSNIEKTIQFYTGFFGQKPSKIKPKYAKFELLSPSLVISFMQDTNRISPAFGHLGFQVETEEALDKYKLAAKENKVSIALEEEGVNCCYAIQDKFWVNDPDGYQWEIYYFHSDAEFNDPSREACCIPAATQEAACC